MPAKTHDLSLAKERREALHRMEAAIGVLRDEYPEIASSYIHMFLAVGNHPGLTPVEYSRYLGMVRAPGGRVLMALSEKARNDQGPLGWLERRRDDKDYREVRYYLSAKGRQLWERIEQTLVPSVSTTVEA